MEIIILKFKEYSLFHEYVPLKQLNNPELNVFFY